ncbi:MAG: hypothetical protein IIY44_05055 [Erysipelotrichales bacterium]|nr:hypothetical protein [Erysipelotrichales bacterium]MBQ1386603.1 hypothetical protein [Erysipelotrichales bacterium]MBQ4375632.1 hypothetical protein [Erysipelotrichales bacterium]
MKSFSMNNYTSYYQFHKNEKKHIYEAMQNITVGDYIGICFYYKTNWDYRESYFYAPMVVKVLDKRNGKEGFLGIGKGPMLKVETWDGEQIVVFDEKRVEFNEPLSDPILSSAIVRKFFFDKDITYKTPYYVESISYNDARCYEYELVVFENNVEIKNAMEAYKGTLVSEEQRSAYHKKEEEKKQEQLRKEQEEQRQFEEADRQAAQEIDDLFNSMRKK